MSIRIGKSFEKLKTQKGWQFLTKVPQLYTIHDPCIIKIYIIMVLTNIHKHNEISLYSQWSTTCFDQPYGHLWGCKIQRLNTLEV